MTWRKFQAEVRSVFLTSADTGYETFSSEWIAADTDGGAITINAPVGPRDGDTFIVWDYGRNFNVNNATISFGAEKFESVAGVNFNCNIRDRIYVFCYKNSTTGWTEFEWRLFA